MIELLLQAERALSVGLLDRAETLYRQVADSDPRNSIAVVGLARVTLERGDDSGALTLARRALTIDSENAAAQRMVRRLEEVIEYRGDALPPAAVPETATTVVAATLEPQPVPTPPEPARATPAPQPAAISEYPPANQPEPHPPARRRSWLDRLFRRR